MNDLFHKKSINQGPYSLNCLEVSLLFLLGGVITLMMLGFLCLGCSVGQIKFSNKWVCEMFLVFSKISTLFVLPANVLSELNN